VSGANYNERAESRMSIIARWMLLVPACATPVVISAWQSLSVPELAGIGAGVATWTVAMIRLHVWRLATGAYGETSRLTLSAMLLMAAEWLLMVTAPSISLLVMFAPSAILVAAIVPTVLTSVDPLMAYLVTIVCGAQALAFVVAIWWLTERFQRRQN
jgi:hypothetical protein